MAEVLPTPPRRLAFALGLLLALPSLWMGFHLDDYMQVSTIEGRFDSETHFDLYEDFTYETPIPWWRADDWHIAFFRPLSSALLRLDHALFGRWAPAWHLHSLLWLGLLLAVAGALYARLVKPVVAAWALLFFALDESHAMTSGLVCNRHATVTTALALAAFLAHLEWRLRGWAPGRWLAPLGFLVALFAGELALSALAYFLAWELCVARDSVARRVRALLPYLGLTALYLVFYRMEGYGPKGSGFYLDPFHRPLEAAWGLAGHLPAFTGSAFTAFPAGLWALATVRPWLIASGFVAVMVLVLAYRGVRRELAAPDRRLLVFWFLGAFASLLPAAMAPPSDRQLLVPALGVSALLAELFVLFGGAWRRHRRPLAALGVVLLVVLHLGLAPVGRLMTLWGLTQLDDALGVMVDQVQAASPVEGEGPVVLVNCPDMPLALYAPGMLRFRGDPRADRWSVLSAAPVAHRLVRVGPRALELETPRGEMLATTWERTLRSGGDRLAVGEGGRAAAFTARVLEVGKKGPTRVRFDFSVSLDTVTFLLWDGSIHSFEPPALGESVELPLVPGPMTIL